MVGLKQDVKTSKKVFDKKIRCGWCLGDILYMKYHDEEWGVKELNSEKLFEMLSLEMMQAGLSWITVLRKRNTMREAFYGFRPAKLAEAGAKHIERWLQNEGIIRHRGKVEALVNNSQLFLLEKNFSDLLWSFKPERETNEKKIPSFTEESVAMSRMLKKKGYKFAGPTTCYAFMQSCGMVNDHDPACWKYNLFE